MMSFLITVLLLVWVVIIVNLDIGTIRLFNDSSQVEDIRDSVFWLFHRKSKGSILAILSALMALTVIIVIILPAICYVCAGRLDNSLVIQHLLKYVMWLIMTCGVVEAIMFPFGLADVYNHSNNIKLIKMGWISIVFDTIEIALVVFTIIKVIIGGLTMGRRTKDHAILVAREESTKNRIKNNWFKPVNRIVVSKYYPSPLEGAPTVWRYKGTIARGKEYRQLHKVDPNFYTYVGKVGK